MRRPLLRSLMTVAFVIPASVNAQATEERAAVQSVVTAFADAIHTGALSEIDALFTPSGVHILVDNAALHGWADYRDEHLRAEMARYSDVRYAHTGIEATVRGNIAWAAFRWQMSGAAAGPAPVLGRGTAILERINGQWLIAHLHFSK